AFGAVVEDVVGQPLGLRGGQDRSLGVGRGGAGVGRRGCVTGRGRWVLGPGGAEAEYGQDQRTQADALCTHVVLAFSGPARSQGRADNEPSSDGPFYSSDA